jgi:hypothetical protein
MAFDNPFKKLSKPQLYAAIGGTVLIGGVIEYKHHQSTGSWNPFSKGSATATGSAIDPVTNLPASEDDQIDPITQLPYLQEAQEYGSVAAAEASVSAYGATSNTGSGIGVSPVSPNTSGSTSAAGSVNSSTYTSDAAWVQAATAGLADIGYNETDVATALGDYVTQTPVTAAQAQLINTAIAEYGPPPIGNLQVIQAPTSSPAATVKVPGDLIGQAQEAAFAILSAAGLHATGTPTVKGKTLIVQTVTPAEGTTVAPGATIKLTSKVEG